MLDKSSLDRLLEELVRYKAQIPVPDEYKWQIPDNPPIRIPDEIQGSYERNIYLKENLKNVLTTDSGLNAHYWIIREWGGIRSFKQSDRNDTILSEFTASLTKGRLKRTHFNLISSLSKVASFKDPDKFAIYDSRSVYALNWLLFRNTDDRLLFPQPLGRSRALAEFDLKTIFRLSRIPHAYREYQMAYFEYCALLQHLSEVVYGDARPCHVEMLLFLIAPEYTVEDIRRSVTVSIN